MSLPIVSQQDDASVIIENFYLDIPVLAQLLSALANSDWWREWFS